MVLDVGGDEVGYCASEGCKVGFESGSEGDGGEDCEVLGGECYCMLLVWYSSILYRMHMQV